VRGAHDACCAVDVTAEIQLVLPHLHHASVDAAANGQIEVAQRGGPSDFVLQVDRGENRVDRLLEDGVDAVSGQLHQPTVVTRDDVHCSAVVPGQGRTHGIRSLVRQP